MIAGTHTGTTSVQSGNGTDTIDIQTTRGTPQLAAKQARTQSTCLPPAHRQLSTVVVEPQ